MTAIVSLILALLFVWAFAEAYSWPVVPDAALALVVFVAPDLALWGVAAVACGSTMGGASAILARRHGWRWPLPLITPLMRQRVTEWMSEGAVGLRHQPLTAVPYKAFVVEAADRGISVTRFAGLTLAFRGLRMAGTAGLTLSASLAIDRLFAPDSDDPIRGFVMATAVVCFLIGWRFTHRMWTKPETVAEARSSGEPTARAHTMRP
jgi:hypothetical protein